MTPPRLGAREGAFTLDGRRTFLFDGEFHYFRVRPTLWRAGLEHLKACGMNAVSTYIPWVWHELEEGRFDFTGETKPGRDLRAFLDQAREVGLFVMARPGPLIYAEFDGFGIPLWLGDRYPDSVVVRRDGRREQGEFFWSHSLGHPTYRAKARAWYEAVTKFLAPWWNDPIITFQIDNETGLLFANKVGQIDFNVDTLLRYRRWLEAQYESVERLNSLWDTKHGSFAEVLPPRPPLRQPEVLDWQRFLEFWIDDYVNWLADVAHECGVPVPLVHNEQGIQHSPLHAKIDYVGYDIYPKASPAKFTADFPFAGSLYPGMFSAYRTDERPTLAIELGTGWFDPRTTVSNAAVVQNVFGSLAHGARGLCLFPMHDGREPSGEPYDFGAPLDEYGRPTARYPIVADIGRFLERWGDDLLHMEEVTDPVGFGIYFPNFRYAAVDYLQYSVQVDPHRYLSFLANGGLHALLLCAGVNPKVVDLRELPVKPLADLQIVLFSTKGMIDPELYDKLENWVLGGGHLVTAPGPPVLDLYGAKARLSTLYPIAPSHTDWLDLVRVWRTVVAGIVPYLLFERPWLSDRHRSSAHVLDLFEPLLDALRAPVKGRRFEIRPAVDSTGARLPARPARVAIADAAPPSIRGDYVCHTFPEPTAEQAEDGVRPGPLWWEDKPASYEVALGWGSSTVLGTLPAGRYLTPRYYSMPAKERRALRHFARGLLADRGVTPRLHPDVEAECVGHAGEDGGMLFIINRLGAQSGDIRIVDPDAYGYTGRLEVAYTFAGSHARAVDRHAIHVDLAAEDVLVLRLR